MVSVVSLVLRGVGGTVLPGRTFFWDIVMCGHLRFRIGCVCKYLTLRNGDALEEVRGLKHPENRAKQRLLPGCA